MPFLDDTQKIGALLTGFGVFFSFLGVMMLFDRGLLAIGNILFLAGVTTVIGFQKALKFFFQKRKLRGTTCFLGGIALVLIGWVFIGFFVEVFGFINLFGDFFPIVLAFAKRLPVIGTVLSMPFIKQTIDRVVSGGSLPV
eukprot:TRINITY_DN3925_c0_g1_i1.p1 TRINITY_DN3925_c0_g1~~TRINITY_DN3925_c0_g1_i1.p1  ORF type:complete len:140 (-),score=1.97 TRINITY_DN3925_c0_g1_i1:50-469(-)